MSASTDEEKALGEMHAILNKMLVGMNEYTPGSFAMTAQAGRIEILASNSAVNKEIHPLLESQFNALLPEFLRNLGFKVTATAANRSIVIEPTEEAVKAFRQGVFKNRDEVIKRYFEKVQIIENYFIEESRVIDLERQAAVPPAPKSPIQFLSNFMGNKPQRTSPFEVPGKPASVNPKQLGKEAAQQVIRDTEERPLKIRRDDEALNLEANRVQEAYDRRAQEIDNIEKLFDKLNTARESVALSSSNRTI